jgi:hypothetical protein
MPKKHPPVDICKHHILRKNCDVAECHPDIERERTNEDRKHMMAVRNCVVRSQDAIESYPWTDLKTKKKLDGHYMFSMMLRYARKTFHPVQEVFVIASEFKMSRHSLYRLQKAAVEAGLLQGTGKRSWLDAPIFVINEQVLKEWAAKDALTHEIEQKFREGMRTPVDPDDAKEEQDQFAAEEADNYDNVEDAPFDPMSTAWPDHETAIGHRVDLTGEPTTPIVRLCETLGCGKPPRDAYSRLCYDCAGVEKPEPVNFLTSSEPAPTPEPPKPAPVASTPKPWRPEIEPIDTIHRFHLGICRRCSKTHQAWESSGKTLKCAPGGTPAPKSSVCYCDRNQFECVVCFPKEVEVVA